MRVLIDTNVLLDVLCNRPDFLQDSSNVFKLCEIGKIEGYISALSIPNIVYILRKEMDFKQASEIIRKLSLIFSIEDLKGDDMLKALVEPFNDFEDALQVIAAKRCKATYIITRNTKDFVNSPILAVEPRKYLERLLMD